MRSIAPIHSGMTLFLALIALISSGMMLFMLLIITQVSDANKAQVRTTVCFNSEGQSVDVRHAVQCRVVAIRELRR